MSRVATLLDRFAARLAFIHASRTFTRFRRCLDDVRAAQQNALQRVLRQLAGSDFSREHGLDRAASLDDLRRAVPLRTYDDFRPWIDRLQHGDWRALFGHGRPLVMFATSSGTTASPKLIPVTSEFVADYRRGWNTFGLKMLVDHPAAVLRGILQSSGRFDAAHTPAGTPCGAITGLMARTQKRIVRRYYVGRPEIADLPDAAARYYTLMRMGAGRDVAFAITASPATLIELARIADANSESLIRDVHDGTLNGRLVPPGSARARITSRLRPNRRRAAQLESLRSRTGRLRPADMWRIEFLACWIGGTMANYRQRLREWWGPVPIRDVGLLASEGRVTIPLEDDLPVGVLDVTAAVFEFFPAERFPPAPDEMTCAAHELEAGRDYCVVLTNSTGLVRYRLDDVVRCHGHLSGAPLLEFTHRAGGVCSVSGEKLTERQVVAAFEVACDKLGIPEADYLVAPCWGDPPFYRVTASIALDPAWSAEFDAALCRANEEYESRRSSNRLSQSVLRHLPQACFIEMDARLRAARGSTAEQYKRPVLLTRLGDDDRLLGIPAPPSP